MRANCQRIGGKIEDAANTGDNRRQTLEIGKANGHLETISGCRFDDQNTAFVADRDRAGILAA
jgi:hypothetical protein